MDNSGVETKSGKLGVARTSPWIILLIGKGGGGKTSTAINLACAALESGLSVGLFDLDAQRCTTTWCRIRDNAKIPVRSCTTAEALDFLGRVPADRIDLLLIDTGKDPSAHLADLARLADLALIPTRPSLFDISVTLEWVKWLRKQGTRFAVVINAAPPKRRVRARIATDERFVVRESPLVREARAALSPVGNRLWRYQLTHLHASVRAIADGSGLIETDPEGAAAREIRQLWKDVRADLMGRKGAA